jgi:GTPase SAR1 family protein
MNAHSYEMEKTSLINEIEHTSVLIDKLIDNLDLELVNSQQLDKIKIYNEKNKKLKHKLESNEFEIAIVGLEKAGKSTFANALIDNYVLPSAPERCTFTTTRLVSGSDKATVEFYTEIEFNKIFQEMLAELEYPAAESISFKDLDINEFESYFLNLEEKNNQLYKNHVGKTDQEILDILKSKSKLTLNGGKIEFHGEELNEDKFQFYIKGEKNDTSKPRSVKKIEIESSKLNQIETAIIYDVPGFDSPTKLHMRQTEERLKNADAIILVTNAGTNPSIQGTSLSVITKNTDSDGIALKDKLFVFGNQIDRVNNPDQLTGNYEILKNDVLKYKIGTEKRIFSGSAYKYLVSEKSIIQDKDYVCKYEIDSGIDLIRSELEHYYQTERFQILKQKIDTNLKCIKSIFEEIHQNNDSNYNVDISSDKQKSLIITAEYRNIQKRLREQLKTFIFNKKHQINNEKWLSSKIQEEIESGKYFNEIEEDFFDKIRILTDESIRVDLQVERINRHMRDKIHLQYLEDYLNLIKDITNENCQEIEVLLLKEFTTAVTGNSSYNDEVQKLCENIIKKITSEVAHNSYRFTYLVERFSRDIFDILLNSPISSQDRMNRFERASHEVIHLDHYYSKGQGNLVNILLSQNESSLIVDAVNTLPKLTLDVIKIADRTNGAAHAIESLEKILKLFKDIVPASIVDKIPNPQVILEKYNIQPSSTKEGVIKEINGDINNLKKILIKAVIPAIDLELVFINGVDKQVKLLLSAMENETHKFAKTFDEFLSNIVPIIKKNELDNVENIIERLELKKSILNSLLV